jgi:hypothetical protein
MRWKEVREQYPEQWLVIEALEAHTEDDRRRLEQMAVVQVCLDGAAAYQRYCELHREYPACEFYFAHRSGRVGYPRKALAGIAEELCS